MGIWTLIIGAILVTYFFRQYEKRNQDDDFSQYKKSNIIELNHPLKVGDSIELSGGYDFDPIYLKKPKSSKRSGTIIQFIPGQNETKAAVVKLDEKFSGDKITGDIVVLELRHVGQTWKQPTPVHVELCDFIPDDKSWKDRKQGEWVEAAATVTLVKTAD